ncbi:unnamed protein product [Pleuronectes platessa]|uniref:Uncharacterized protein n=1 Tax=Pleuronectes platessa TaxID=8262 RepID=A0A9N7YCR3_PLEPL|nr:unnamed protein product [Pleuronectes platessa]
MHERLRTLAVALQHSSRSHCSQSHARLATGHALFPLSPMRFSPVGFPFRAHFRRVCGYSGPTPALLVRLVDLWVAGLPLPSSRRLVGTSPVGKMLCQLVGSPPAPPVVLR